MEIGQRTRHTPPRHQANRIVYLRKLRTQVQVFKGEHDPWENIVSTCNVLYLCNLFYPWNCSKRVAELAATE